MAGLAADANQGSGFIFAGFLSSKSGERTTEVQALALETRAVVFLEAPHRIEALAHTLQTLGTRKVTIGRELTKQFEEIATLAACDLPAWLDANPNRLRGEFALVLHPVAAQVKAGTDYRVLKLLLAERPLKTAVKLAVEITGVSRNVLYEAALSMKANRA